MLIGSSGGRRPASFTARSADTVAERGHRTRFVLGRTVSGAALPIVLALSGCSADGAGDPGAAAGSGPPSVASPSATDPPPGSPSTPSASPSAPPLATPPPGGPLERRADVAFGMAAPAALWSTRLAEVGEIEARRVFGQLGDPDKALQIARDELAAGREPVVSFKLPGADWAGAASGRYDERLRYIARELAAPGGRVFVTLHHEPASDGSPGDYAAMMRHALPILGAPENVDAGPILNGFWWSDHDQGLSDEQIAQWLPSDVLAASELVAADAYQTQSGGRVIEGADTKIVNFSAWARRVGVERLGIAEYNGATAAALEEAGRAVLIDPRMEFALVFNSNVNNAPDRDLELSGPRLDAFRRTLATARELRAD